MVSKKELQSLSGFLEWNANFVSDAQLAQLLSGASSRRSAGSKPTVLEAPEPDEVPALRKRKASTAPKHPSKGRTLKDNSTGTATVPPVSANVFSSSSTLSPPPSDLDLDADEESYTCSVKRQKRLPRTTSMQDNLGRRLIVTFKFNNVENQRRLLIILAKGPTATVSKTDATQGPAHGQSTNDIRDEDPSDSGCEEFDDSDDEPEHVPAVKCSNRPAPKTLTLKAQAKTGAWKIQQKKTTRAPNVKISSAPQLVSQPRLPCAVVKAEDVRPLRLSLLESTVF